MPQERESQYPHVTREDWEKIKAETPRARTAARAVIVRQITGAPRRGYLTGDSDHAPILRGVEEFMDKVWALLDSLDHIEGGMPAVVEDAASEVAGMMEGPDGL